MLNTTKQNNTSFLEEHYILQHMHIASNGLKIRSCGFQTCVRTPEAKKFLDNDKESFYNLVYWHKIVHLSNATSFTTSFNS